MTTRVPSLFSSRTWTIQVGGGARWTEIFKVWEADGLIKGQPELTPVQMNQTVDLSGWARRFLIPISRSTAHLDHAGAVHLLPLVQHDLWGAVSRVSRKLTVGIFQSADGRPSWLNLEPSAENLGAAESFPYLHAAGLAPIPLGRQVPYVSIASFFTPLNDPAHQGRWYLLAHTLLRQTVSGVEQVLMSPGLAFDALNLAMREVRGTQYVGSPFQGLVPTFSSPDSDFDPLTLVALEPAASRGSEKAWATKLLRLDLGDRAVGKALVVDLDWFYPYRDSGGPAGATGFRLQGEISTEVGSQQFQHGWEADPRTRTATLEAMLASAEMIESTDEIKPAGEIASFRLVNCKLVGDPAWIRLGSFEVRPRPNSTCTLNVRVRGEIGTGATAVYPECDLQGLVCEVRNAAGADPRPEHASFSRGTTTADGRESTPLVARRQQEQVRTGTLSMRTKYEGGRDALTELRLVLRNDGERFRGSAVWLNLRPFLPALIDFPDTKDTETTLVWRNDDPQGAQWRVEDPTVTVILPPQAVGEEMERGSRFYVDPTKPNLDPAAPIRYRFSRATYLTLRPSPPEQNRRFERQGVNFRELIRGSQVERLTFEMAYPMEVMYQRSSTSTRTILLTEAGEFMGQPTENLSLDEEHLQRGTQQPGSLPKYVQSLQGAGKQGYIDAVRRISVRQSAAQSNFASRLAELHVHDPARPRDDMRLDEGVRIRLRHTGQGATGLINPMPRSLPAVPASPLPNGAFLRFLKNGAWSDEKAGSFRGGLIHTFELPSELVEVLDTPEAVAGMIEALSLSALGATGRMEAAFASGKTSFAVVVAHGQLSRVVKTRIGRIGALWNRAKHVVVYERSTARSAQFQAEQSLTDALTGWPVLRKAEEYIEPIQVERNFYEEEQKTSNATGFIEAAVFASPRIYVNSAWARDLQDGYELPLWDQAAAATDPKFYPRPRICLQCFGEDGRRTRLWFSEPQNLYFYTSAALGAGADTDAWLPQKGVDFENLPRWPIMEPATADDLKPRTPASPELCTSRRFDLAVEAEGPVNLQYGRGSTPMLVTLQRVSISRSSQVAPVEPEKLPKALDAAQKALTAVAAARRSAADLAPSIARLEGELRDRLERQLHSGAGCDSIAKELKALVSRRLADFRANLNPLSQFGQDLPALAQRSRDMWLATSADFMSQLRSRALLQERVLGARVEALRATLAELRRALPAGNGELPPEVRQQVAAYTAEGAMLSDDLRQRALVHLAQVAQLLQDVLTEAAKDVNRSATTLGQVGDTFGDLQAKCQQAAKDAASALDRIEKLPESARRLVEAPSNWLGFLRGQLAPLSGSAVFLLQLPKDRVKALAAALAKSAGTIQVLAAELAKWATGVSARATAVANPVGVLAKRLSDLGQDLAAATRADVARAKLAQLEAFLAAGGSDLLAQHRELAAKLETDLSVASEEFGALLTDVNKKLIDRIAYEATGLASEVGQLANAVEKDLFTVIDQGEAQCEKLLATLREKLRETEAWARRQAEAALDQVLSSEAARQIGHYAQTTKEVADIGSRALGLARAVGSLPSITPLKFDIDVAAYVFDGTKPQIRMSPAIAELRAEGGKLLESLGLAVPCNALLDRLVPAIPGGKFDFNQIFRKFAGIDFSGLFRNFRLPALDENIRITHGFDKPTRRAWVNSTVAFAKADYQELFAAGPVALGLERLAMDAFTGIETRMVGNTVQPPVTRSRATLLADWVLQGGGQRLVTFQQVALKYDGAAGFDFDVSPDKIVLHPSLRFITEFVQQYKGSVPPAIQIEEEGGRPVGVSAGTTVVVDDLPDLGGVVIGPIDMRSSLGLRMENPGRRFAITSAFSLGSKQAPIFVQIGWLGGGCWLETRVKYVDGTVTPSLSVGLSVGSTRRFNLAGVASGSFNVQLYCYIEIQAGRESIAIGLSVAGSALIVGFVNANVRLLLEATHSRGTTEGTGRLDVQVKISWFYTFRFKRTVRHRF